jgi:excisionase family DNA binding protein
MAGKMNVKRTLRVDELAKDWSVNPRTIRREIDRGELGAFKVGDTWRIPVEEAEKYRLANKKNDPE